MPMQRAAIALSVTAGLTLSLPALPGCESLPGGKKEQGAVIGGAGGAIAGAAIAKNNRLLGGLIGGLVGAGGGYLIGSQMEKADADDEQNTQQARQAVTKAKNDPATAAEAQAADTADINGDGFVTLDEVIAMEKAGFSDQKMINRLEATDQVFELAPRQEDELLRAGVSRNVVNQLDTINQDQRDELLQQRDQARQPNRPVRHHLIHDPMRI